MSDIDDYVLDPFTVWAMQQFRDGNDPSRGEQYVGDLVREVLDEIDNLGDTQKGLVIIDLLTLLNAMEQIVSIMQVWAIEEAQK